MGPLNSESHCGVTDLGPSHRGCLSSCKQVSSPVWLGVTTELWVHENIACDRCSKALLLPVLVLTVQLWARIIH